MENYSAMIRNTFELCSVRDGEALFEACVQNAFPIFRFRHLELIRIDPDRIYLEGRSWNHVFEIQKTTLEGHDVWLVHCHRVTMGQTPDKYVYLDYLTLDFIRYQAEP